MAAETFLCEVFGDKSMKWSKYPGQGKAKPRRQYEIAGKRETPCRKQIRKKIFGTWKIVGTSKVTLNLAVGVQK